jgi:hypothetical protein
VAPAVGMMAAMVLAGRAAEVVAVDSDMAGAGDGSASLPHYSSLVRLADFAVRSQVLTEVLDRLD